MFTYSKEGESITNPPSTPEDVVSKNALLREGTLIVKVVTLSWRHFSTTKS
ncbi:hypothetical protein YC2023_035381 [Brassica napus]